MGVRMKCERMEAAISRVASAGDRRTSLQLQTCHLLLNRLQFHPEHVFVPGVTGGLQLRLRLRQRQLERPSPFGARAFLFCQRWARPAGAIAQRFFLLLLD